MNKKEAFIKLVEELLKPIDITSLDEEDQLALEYFEELKSNKSKEKTDLTENGKKVLAYMQDCYNKDNKFNTFTSKDIAEGLFVSSRSVSGSMRKLISEGYVDKLSASPVTYGLTPAGIEKELN
jgi:DNA-binding MarR family transcriptional regulator